ncbi:alpha/beta hydrolase domain-containing protein [uncultured Phenylobacterium sp.]|uniref:alpha/beta hydrolase domain-containing protein n=1 Tax=uncultured Phenylobacterium sp. TaxID=349273 RepID=UPI0025F48A69|nr:alpha/beta hydrolase domain-containing protein [uncultured Phenylobacterium sp.]
MGAMHNLWRLAAGAALAIGLAGAAIAAPPKVTAVAGEPTLALASFDLKALGFVVEEYFLAGDATSYKPVGPQGPDGKWQAAAAGTSPYVTRLVVVRPADPKRFNGTAAVEWLNVTPGQDISPDWSYTHRELMRSGYAYVGVSVQKVGIEGGQSMAGPGAGLKKMKPERYSGLSHPGDAFAFDIYSQAGRVVRGGAVLGPLKVKRMLALGESQSAIFMTTYVNAIDPLDKVYDGFFVHSRFGGAPSVDAARGPMQQAQGVRFRPDRRAPVMAVLAETDITSQGGWWTAEQPDDAKLRVWQIPGAAHADTYMLQVAANDSGQAPIEKLADLWKPTATTVVGRLAKPMNSGPQHHYVAQAALAHLETWVRTGKAPPSAPRVETTPGAASAPPTLVLDANGNTKGGIRTPWVDAPTAKLSGFGNSGSGFAFLFGTTEAYDAATLQRLYPGGKADYLKAFDAALAKAVKAGYILPADQNEARAVAAAMYPG